MVRIYRRLKQSNKINSNCIKSCLEIVFTVTIKEACHGFYPFFVHDVVITAYLTLKKEKMTVTDGRGDYAFNDLRPGTYKFVFEKEGYKKVTKEKWLFVRKKDLN